MADKIRMGDAVLTRVVEAQVDNLPVTVFPQLRRKRGVSSPTSLGRRSSTMPAGELHCRRG